MGKRRHSSLGLARWVGETPNHNTLQRGQQWEARQLGIWLPHQTRDTSLQGRASHIIRAGMSLGPEFCVATSLVPTPTSPVTKPCSVTTH